MRDNKRRCTMRDDAALPWRGLSFGSPLRSTNFGTGPDQYFRSAKSKFRSIQIATGIIRRTRPDGCDAIARRFQRWMANLQTSAASPVRAEFSPSWQLTLLDLPGAAAIRSPESGVR